MFSNIYIAIILNLIAIGVFAGFVLSRDEGERNLRLYLEQRFLNLEKIVKKLDGLHEVIKKELENKTKVVQTQLSASEETVGNVTRDIKNLDERLTTSIGILDELQKELLEKNVILTEIK
jgi:hypothetical protein